MLGNGPIRESRAPSFDSMFTLPCTCTRFGDFNHEHYLVHVRGWRFRTNKYTSYMYEFGTERVNENQIQTAHTDFKPLSTAK